MMLWKVLHSLCNMHSICNMPAPGTSAVILEPKKIKSATVSPSICHEVMGTDAMILVF